MSGAWVRVSIRLFASRFLSVACQHPLLLDHLPAEDTSGARVRFKTRGISAVVEPGVVMIRPAPARCCQASCRPWNRPLTLTAKLRSNSASVTWANGLGIATAALFTRTSHRAHAAGG